MKCPDCNSALKTDLTTGYAKCNKCLQEVKIINGKPVNAYPKSIFG